MENSIKFDIKYDYSIALVFSDNSETLIGGTEKIMKKAFKNSSVPTLNTKGLDIYYREKPLGTLAADINGSVLDAEKVQNLVDKLYANLLDKRTSNAKIADTKISLDAPVSRRQERCYTHFIPDDLGVVRCRNRPLYEREIRHTPKAKRTHRAR